MQQAEQARERLQVVARDGGLLYDQLLRRYAWERLVHRLITSSPDGDFALRGGTAIEARLGVPHRLMQAPQLRGRPSMTAVKLRASIRGLARDLLLDGLQLDVGSVRARRVRERPGETTIEMVTFAKLLKAQIPVQLDVTLHDVVRPPAEKMTIPLLLSARGYPVDVLRYESLMADCVVGLIQRGSAHARMSDLYDAWLLAQVDPLEQLGVALGDVLKVHQIPVPDAPAALSEQFVTSDHARRHWDAFVRKASPMTEVDLADAVLQVRDLVLPILDDLR